MQPVTRPLRHDLVELRPRVGTRIVAVERKIEVILVLEILELLQVVDQQEDRRVIGRDLLVRRSPFHFLAQLAHHTWQIVVFYDLHLVWHRFHHSLQERGLGRSGGGSVTYNEPDPTLPRLGGKGDQRNGQHGQGRLLPLTDHDQVVPALAMEGCLRWTLDGVGRTQPGPLGKRRFHRLGVQEVVEQPVLADISRRVPLEDNGSGTVIRVFLRDREDMLKRLIPLFIRQPDHLERAVGFQGTGAVVVDPLPRACQHAWGRVGVIHDEIGIRLIALQGHPDDHLTHRGTGHAVGAAQCL